MKSLFKRKADGKKVDIVKTDDIFDSLDSTCNMMTSGINRCLDYMKASSDIKLIPKMETFHLLSTTQIAVRCVTNHLNSGSKIIVHALSSKICPFLISDKQWLSENLLCLLSNAVKYSNIGAVDLRIELVSELCSEQNEILVASRIGEKNSVEFPVLEISSKSMAAMTDNTDYSIKTYNKTDDSIINKSENRLMIRVSVEDQGIGIEEEARKKLFQPFEQAQRSAGGTGEFANNRVCYSLFFCCLCTKLLHLFTIQF